MVLHDRRHNPAGHSIHNHFIVKALHLVRPGGLVAVLTSRFTMDARNPAARREIAALADLVGAIRLPSGAHQRAAGTGVVTDLLVLRRREPGREPDSAAWEQARHAELDGAQVPVNEYFLDHPEAVLGQMGAVHGAYRADDLVVRPAGDTIAAFMRRPGRADRSIGPDRAASTWTPQRDRAGRRAPDREPEARVPPSPTGTCVPGRTARSPGSSTAPSSRMRSRPARPPNCEHLLGAARHARGPCSTAEAASAEDTPEIGELRAELGRRYDPYLRCLRPAEPVLAAAHRPDRPGDRRAGHGPDPAAARRVRAATRSPRWSTRWRSSTRSASGPPRRRSSANGSSPRARRGSAPTPRPTRWPSAWTPAAKSALDEIARLLGTTEDDAREQLGTLVFDDPATGQLVPAAEYLSGNVREKLRDAEQRGRGRPAVRGQRRRTAPR